MRNILIVDDEPEILEGMLDILCGMKGVALHTANLAAQALHMIQNTKFDLVVADIRMPGINGIEMWERIHSEQPHCRVLFLSGVRNFDNVYRAIQNPQARFLTKMEPDDKIRDVVKSILDEIVANEKDWLAQQQKAVLAFLSGTAGANETKRLIDQVAYPLADLRCFDVMWIGIAHASVFPDQTVWSILCAICDEELEEITDSIPLHAIVDYESLLFLLPCGNSADTLRQHLQRMITWGSERFKVALLGGYACMCSQPDNLRQAHAQITARLCNMQQRLTGPIEDLMPVEGHKGTYRNEKSKPANPHYYTDIQSLKSFLELGQEKHFLELFDVLVKEHAAGQTLNSETALQLFYVILSLVRRTAAKWKLDDLNDVENGIVERLQTLSYQSWGAATDDLRNLIHLVFARRFQTEKYKADNSMQAIQAYIQEHMGEEMTLNSLSTQFNYHPNYLSRLFKETTGINISDYIRQVRLGAAEVMLRITLEKINQIGKKVGYESAHTFIRAFRKTFGKTPQEYRMDFLEGRNDKPKGGGEPQ